MAFESWVVEQAKEELQILEFHDPNRFDYLKLELKGLISQSNKFSSPAFLFQNLVPVPENSFSTSAATQGSSNRKKRKGSEFQESVGVLQKSKFGKRGNCSKDRVDVAIERAEACLRKIREMKESFFKGRDVL